MARRDKGLASCPGTAPTSSPTGLEPLPKPPPELPVVVTASDRGGLRD